MKINKNVASTTATLAGIAVVGMLVGAAQASSGSLVLAGMQATAGMTAMAWGMHHCKGMNKCKGQGGCKTATHSCAGQNSCKGKGGCNTIAPKNPMTNGGQ